MRIAILSKTGIEKVIDETLQNLPVNRRFSRVNGKVYETIPYKVNLIHPHSSYSQDMNETSRIIDLIGPYEDVPNFAVASNKEERERILKPLQSTLDIGYNSIVSQDQLIVLSHDVFYRQLNLSVRKRILAETIEGVHFSNCRWISQKEVDGIRQRKIKNKRIWEHVVEDMADYFLTYTFNSDSTKVFYGSEEIRDKVIKVFDKFGLKLIK